MKACLIIDSNIDMLASRYQIESEDREDRLPLGYWLVASFGDEGLEPFEVVHPDALIDRYTLGEQLQNGFVELISKEV